MEKYNKNILKFDRTNMNHKTKTKFKQSFFNDLYIAKPTDLLIQKSHTNYF